MADVVHMLVDTTGSPNGFDVYTYHEGERYTIGDEKMSEHLAEIFVENGSAEMKSGKAGETKPEQHQAGDGGGKLLTPTQEHELRQQQQPGRKP